MKRALIAVALLVAFGVAFSPLIASVAGSGVAFSALRFDHAELRALGAHLVVALAAGLTALLLGAPFAIFVGGTRSPLRGFLLALGALTLAVPQYLAAETWIDLVGPAGRVLRLFVPASQDVQRLGVYEWAGFVYTAPFAGFVIGACLMPIVALAVAAADRRTDARLREAARLARGRAGAFVVSARALGPAALGGALLVFALALTEFATPQCLRVRTLGEDVFTRANEGDRAGAAAIGLLLVIVTLAFMALAALLLARRRVASTAALEGDVPRFELRPSRPLVATLVGLLAVTPGVLAPLVSMNIQVRTAKLGSALASAWANWRGDTIRTFAASAAAATIAVLLAAVLGRALRAPTRRNAIVAGALGAALAVPAPLVGLGLIVLWNRPVVGWVYDGVGVVLLGWLARFLPVAVLLGRASFARVPFELEQAAALMGKRGASRLRAIVLPLAAPGLVAAWLAVYVSAATEFGATELVMPPGQPYLASTVVNQIHYGQSADIAAAGLILMAAVVLPLLPLSLLLLLVRRSWRSS